MRKFVLTIAALAAFGLTLPLASPASANEKVVIKTGDRGHHHGWNRSHRKVVVVNRHHDRGLHRGWRNHRGEGSKVVIKSGHRNHMHNHRSGSRVVVKTGRDRD